MKRMNDVLKEIEIVYNFDTGKGLTQEFMLSRKILEERVKWEEAVLF